MAGPMPVVPGGYKLFLDAFYRLNTERQINETHIGSIPYSRLQEFAEWLDIKDVNKFTDVVLALDRNFVNFVTEKRKEESRKARQGS